MCDVFQNQEEEYLVWLNDHPESYVFNDDIAGRVLHRSLCIFLRRPPDEGRRTVSQKLCCASVGCIVQRIETQYGSEGDRWWRCRAQGANCWN